MADARVLRVEGVSLTVADLEAERAFYEALGFVAAAPVQALSAEQANAGYGVDKAARTLTLRLGGQAIELVAFEPPGESYPEPRAANDPGFQHFALAVSDIQAAYAVLSALRSEPISRGGPQLLPPSTGSVTAYKFRDPEGHPLELSYIPGSAWTDPAQRLGSGPGPGPGPFLGIDHTALAVADLHRSLEFYVDWLGFTLEAQLLNTGPEQDRLDGLNGVQLDIAVLRPAASSSMHVELLGYRRSPSGGARGISLDAVATTRTRLAVSDLASAVHASSVLTSDRARVMIADPDGHVLELTQAE